MLDVPPVDAELKRRNALGDLVSWTLRGPGADDGGLHTDPVSDAEARIRLTEIRDTLQGTLDAVVSGTVALDPASLSALETITATITALPDVNLSATTLAALEQITVALQPGAVVALDSATLTALENITVALAAGTTVALDAATLAALETINVVVQGEVVLADDTPIRVQVVGSGGVQDVSIDPAQVDDLKKVYRHDGTALASEALLEQVRRRLFLSNEVGAVPGVLHEIRTLLADEDFASQTTLAQLLASFNARDISTETTLAALLAAIQAEDFASQTTLEAFRSQFAARDLATQATLLDIRAEQFRRTDPLAEGYNPIGYVAPTVALRGSEGKIWFAGARLAANALQSTTAYFQVLNPVLVGGQPNNKVIAILQLLVDMAGAATRIQFFKVNNSQGLANATDVVPHSTHIGGAIPATFIDTEYSTAAQNTAGWVALPAESLAVEGCDNDQTFDAPYLLYPNWRLVAVATIPQNTTFSMTATFQEP